MKKIMMIALATMALAACGGGSNQSDATKREDQGTTTEQSVTPDASMMDTSSNHNMNEMNTLGDTTSTGRGTGSEAPGSGGTTGGASGGATGGARGAAQPGQ